MFNINYYRRCRLPGLLGFIDPKAWGAEFTEDFETNWFVDDTFSSVFTEDFETNWFVDNTFSSVFTEDFENGGW